jgi:hypothetical protein
MISLGEPPLPPPLTLAGVRGRRRGDDDRQQRQRRQQHDMCSGRSSGMSLCVLLLALVLLVLLPSPTHAGLLKVRTHTHPSLPPSFPFLCSSSMLPQVVKPSSLPPSLPPFLPLGRPPSPLACLLTPSPPRAPGRRASIPEHLPSTQGHSAG